MSFGTAMARPFINTAGASIDQFPPMRGTDPGSETGGGLCHRSALVQPRTSGPGAEPIRCYGVELGGF